MEKPEYHEGFILSNGRRVLVRQGNHGIIMSHMIKSGFKTVTAVVAGICLERAERRGSWELTAVVRP